MTARIRYTQYFNSTQRFLRRPVASEGPFWIRVRSARAKFPECVAGRRGPVGDERENPLIHRGTWPRGSFRSRIDPQNLILRIVRRNLSTEDRRFADRQRTNIGRTRPRWNFRISLDVAARADQRGISSQSDMSSIVNNRSPCPLQSPYLYL